MIVHLSDRIIKQLCGVAGYNHGAEYYSAKKVSFSSYNADTGRFAADVSGGDGGRYGVSITVDQDGAVEAACTCPAFSTYDKYCKHIAAVLLNVRQVERDKLPASQSFPSKLYATSQDGTVEGELLTRHSSAHSRMDDAALGSGQLTETLLEMFDSKTRSSGYATYVVDSRTVLQVDFICKLVSNGSGNYLLGIELRMGSKRVYIVQKIRDFLDAVARQDRYRFSQHFTYDPEQHALSAADEALIRQLIKLEQHEKMYRGTFNASPNFAYRHRNDRMLLVPPLVWRPLIQLLTEAASVKLEHGDSIYEGIRLADERTRLIFYVKQDRDGVCSLHVHGLAEIAIMDAYGLVLSEGKLLELGSEQCGQLIAFGKLLNSSTNQSIAIREDQLEAFMQKVVPALKRFGSVEMDSVIAERLVQTKLRGRLYLDRVRERLLAGLEFQYGDIIMNPLEEAGLRRAEGKILMRDSEREQQIFDLMELSSFAKTESGYFMEDEDAEYRFLYQMIPELEKLVEVHATSAVKVRRFSGAMTPVIKVEVDERTDWLAIQFSMDGIAESEVREILTALSEQRKYYRLPSGAFLSLESGAFAEIRQFTSELGVQSQDWQGSETRLPVLHALRASLPAAGDSAVKFGRKVRRLLNNLRHPDNLDFPVPTGLNAELRDYQVYGYQWLKTLAHYGFGGILADDMGLGKTLQSIVFIASVSSEIRESGMPAIVICPASLLYNWHNEIRKFSPELRVVIQDGSRSERERLLKNAANYDVIITSYPLLRKDVEWYRKKSFHTLILDEAQAFKNYATQTAQAVGAIRAKHRFALTGTPVENAIEELWSIYHVVFPALFPTRKAFGELSRESVARRIRPFLLRRMKSDVLTELPEKIETLHASELLAEQKKLYIAYLAKLRQETVKHLDDQGFQKNRIRILAGITRLRQLCCHPALFVEGYSGGSAKFEQLMDLVEECRSAGKRMLVFSQFTAMLGLIRQELGYRGVSFYYLDGSTPVAERVGMCDRFNAGERELFLVSLKAGGSGLNLTGADTVILYDLWWNPAVEQQAADRAHRIGQKKAVQVIRLVAQGTVEEKMYELQQRKKDLIEQVVQAGEEGGSALTEADIREILLLPQ
ncbi:helicase SNF [Paenibacillaceae bacterium]|nr:helicase SNF [Paenibacillaceae bacterium]